MSSEAQMPTTEEVPLDPFDQLPEAKRRELILRQWTDGTPENGSTIIILRSIAANPLAFSLAEAFPEIANQSSRLHRKWDACQLASDSVRWHLPLGHYLVCLIPSHGRWFAGLDVNDKTIIVGDGFRQPIRCLEELQITLVLMVGIYAGRIAEALRHRAPESEPEVRDSGQAAEDSDQTSEAARDPPE
jgi:hypothetical protein